MRLLREAIDAGVAIHQVVLCPELLGDTEREIRHDLAAAGGTPRLLIVSPAVMRSLSDTVSPQGVIAVVEQPVRSLIALMATASCILVLDGVSDPGNVGTLIRTAAAADCDAVVSIAGGADVYAPKVVRSAMGAHFRIPLIADATWEQIGPTLRGALAVVGTAGAESVTYDALDWVRACALVIGNEDHGVSADARQWCNAMVHIPMARGVESLNASVAGAIILYEIVRQRRQAGAA